ncbi:hypothetical protein [Tuberibacillus sp. Marseille-P3662]|uniref:hypothetical protein n=1 Tax=Tuberibacillus sp. Marseille-P3662 TaxID=1965358 RepID=UPI000A1CA31E|nr:hypothetical protein [Tuberibacillus sp. Marseille-P3662]
MKSPRIFWLCTHQTLRYEEVPLLMEAGAEVIPGLGESFWLKYDPDYENETARLYPHWRKSCTLPTHIVEKLRRIDILGKKGALTPEEASFFNQWVDVIFISNYPEILGNVSKWFQGYVVFRVFGHGDYTTYTEQLRRLNVNIDQVVANDKYVWSPILSSLGKRELPQLSKNKFYLNAFVSQERLGFQWAKDQSQPYLSTTISYLDGNPQAREIYEDFAERFGDIPYVVLGKNSKHAVKGLSDKVLGHLNDQQFFSKIAHSRMFVYFGLGSNYHLHYTPIEAIKMGVPVVFLEQSGLAQEARDHSVSRAKLKTIGMCSNPQEMKQFVQSHYHDFTALEQLAREQSQVLGKIFSRDAALARTKKFIDDIAPYVSQHRTQQYAQPAAFNVLKKDAFRPNVIHKDLPTEPGQTVTFRSENIGSMTGKMIYNHHGKFLSRRVEQRKDAPGMLIAEHIRQLTPGRYRFSIELNSDHAARSSLGAFSLGIWNPQYSVLKSQTISHVKPGANTIELTVHFTPEQADLLKELRLVWNGGHTCEYTHLNVKKLA